MSIRVIVGKKMKFLFLLNCISLPLYLSHSWLGDGSPPRSSPGSSISVLGRFDSGDLAMTPAASGHVLCSITPDVLPSHQHHCKVHKWRSLGVRYGVGRLPTMENGPCAAVPPWCISLLAVVRCKTAMAERLDVALTCCWLAPALAATVLAAAICCYSCNITSDGSAG